VSTISVFAFERQFQQLAGPFHQTHIKADSQSRQLVWEAMWSLPAVHAIVAYVRADSEISQSLSAVVNDQAVLDIVDNQFATAPKTQTCGRRFGRGRSGPPTRLGGMHLPPPRQQ